MKPKKQSKLAQELLLYAILLILFGWLISTYKILLGPLVISGLSRICSIQVSLGFRSEPG